jgi:predicted DNA-binding transcriptional regulator AlpA
MNRGPHHPPGIYSLKACAQRCGVSAERFRKAWPQWFRDRQFPAPMRQPPLANYGWDVAAIEAWITARSRALGQAAPPAFLEEAANNNEAFRDPRLQGGRRITAERAEFIRIMERES